MHLQQSLALGATLVTPSRRSSHAQRHEFAASQRQAVWSAPDIGPLNAWLERLWYQRIVDGLETRVLLNSIQERELWRATLASDPSGSSFRTRDTLVSLASRGWNLLWLYGSRDRPSIRGMSDDERAFARWIRNFEQRLQQNQCITTAQLPSQLGIGTNVLDRQHLLVDLEDQPPAVLNLFEVLKAGNPQLQVVTSETQVESSAFYSAQDDRDEAEAAASWAESSLRANPHAKLAVIVPNLAERSAQLGRIFDQILDPFAISITAHASPPRYEISVGQPLSTLEIGRTALDLLRWIFKPIGLESVSRLLLSPWFSGSDDVAVFDAFELRRIQQLRPEVSLSQAIQLLKSSKRSTAEALRRRLEALQRFGSFTTPGVKGVTNDKSFTEWCYFFRSALKAAQWAVIAQADINAQRQHARWEDALDRMASLDLLSPPCPAARALSLLEEILQATFITNEGELAPIQIMSPEEIRGQHFDGLWFLGADDMLWPPSTSPHPLLPASVQRSSRMPGTQDADEERNRSLTHRIAHSAREVIFSYARNGQDGLRRPSPLLKDLNLSVLESTSPRDSAPALEFQEILDRTSTAKYPDRPVRGGAQILKLQAACAFRAFAEYRLSSTSPQTQDLGFDAGENGTIVHHVMRQFWNGLKDQVALLQMNPRERLARLDDAIRWSLGSVAVHSSWDSAYLEIQHQRLRNLLERWIQIESERPPFAIQSTEDGAKHTLGPLTFDLRFDRLDQVDGGVLILDYKTGAAHPAQWLGARPDDPQMPLYAVMAQQTGLAVQGVAFANLRAGKGLQIAGYADTATVFGKPSAMELATLADQLAAWHEVLLSLAESFANGDATVAPKVYPKTCSTCAQRILCRLDPLALMDESDDEAEGGEDDSDE